MTNQPNLPFTYVTSRCGVYRVRWTNDPIHGWSFWIERRRLRLWYVHVDTRTYATRRPQDEKFEVYYLDAWKAVNDFEMQRPR